MATSFSGSTIDSGNRAFEAHPRMQPPNPHPTLIFLFDFIRNTQHQLQCIDPEKLARCDPEAKEQATEVMGRNLFTKYLIDDRTEKLALMTGCEPDDTVDFGDEIREKIRILTE